MGAKDNNALGGEGRDDAAEVFSSYMKVSEGSADAGFPDSRLQLLLLFEKASRVLTVC